MRLRVAIIGVGTAAVLTMVAPGAFGTAGFHGDGRGIDAPKVVWPGERVLVVATDLRPDRYVVHLLRPRRIPDRPLTCSARVGRARRGSGTVRFYGRIPTRWRCYSSTTKSFTGLVRIGPGYAKFWVEPVRRSTLRGPSIRFQTTTISAIPRFTG